MCHVNMLKAYVNKIANDTPVSYVVSAVATTVLPTAYCPLEDDLVENEDRMSCMRLNNSAVLSNVDLYLAYLPKIQRTHIVELISEYPTLFSDVPHQTTILTHDIDVGDSVPVKQHPYCVNPHKQEVMKSEVEYLLQHGCATPSQSPWSSPCLLVPKSDSSYRFCTDYRRVNNLTKPDSFPLPRIEDCVDRELVLPVTSPSWTF